MPFGVPPLQASNSFIRNRLSKIHMRHPLCPSCALQLRLPSSFLLPTDPIPPSILPYPPSQSHQLHSPLFTLGFLLPPFDICPSTGPFHHHLHSCFLDPHSCAMSSHISLFLFLELPLYLTGHSPSCQLLAFMDTQMPLYQTLPLLRRDLLLQVFPNVCQALRVPSDFVVPVLC